MKLPILFAVQLFTLGWWRPGFSVLLYTEHHVVVKVGEEHVVSLSDSCHEQARVRHTCKRHTYTRITAPSSRLPSFPSTTITS